MRLIKKVAVLSMDDRSQVMDLGDAFLGDALSGDVSSGENHADGMQDSVEMFDVDGDGYEETRTSHTDAGMTVARDRDADGVIDTFTTVGRGGHYETWEIFRAADGTSRWEETSAGDVFE